MKRPIPLILLGVLLVHLFGADAFAVDFKKGSAPLPPPTAGDLSVRVELVGERGGVYGRGKSISVSFSTSRDAYVVVYNVDAEGYVHLLFPADGRPVRTDGRKTHFLPPPGSGSYWETGEVTGIEYIHALAVDDADRLDEDELYFLATSERLSEDRRLRVDLDPFLAFNMIDEEIVRSADRDPPATDYTYFYVNRRVEYPRYLCAKCHSPGSIGDPYAMECPEVVIDRIAYADEPRYPYPALYDIRYADEVNAPDDYASSTYGDDWLGDSDGGKTDTKIYLSFSYGSYASPYYGWPYYGGYYTGWGMYPVWYPFWGFSWSIWWGDYYWWPYSYGWWYPYPGWGHCCNPCWHWGDCWYGHYPAPYRRLYGDRAVVKRSINYGTTYAKLTRERSLSDTRLARSKQRASVERMERSDLRRLTIDRGVDGRTSDLRDRNSRLFREMERTPERGSAARERGIERSPVKGSDRGRTTIDRRTTRTVRGDERRETQKAREADRSRSGVKPNRPERRSRDAERNATPSRPQETGRDKSSTKSGRSDAGADRRRASTGTPARTPERSAGAPTRSSPPPARSPSRSSTPYRGASGRTGSSGKTKSR